MIHYTQRAAVGENAVVKVIPNGLVREARNQERVGAYGEPARYQGGVYEHIHEERTIFRQFGWYRRSYKAFVPFRG